jgi:hypothetical protein
VLVEEALVSHRSRSVVLSLAVGSLLVLAVAPVDGLSPTGHADAAGIGEPIPTTTGTGTDDRGSYVVRFRSGTNPTMQASSLERRGITVDATLAAAFPGAVVRLTASELATLRSDPSVQSIAADAAVGLSEPPDETFRASSVQSAPTWGLDRIDQRGPVSSGAFDSSYNGTGVKVYVLDSGVRWDHEQFGGRVLPGAYLSGFGSSNDCTGHGTHVAGTIGSATYGVADNVLIVPVRVLDCAGLGTAAGIILGLDWIVANHLPGEPAVLNMSIGGPSNLLVDQWVQAVIDDGVTAVIAAGNDGVPACFDSPARLPAAITVAATDITDFSPDWSNYGTCVDIFAPGESVLSTWHTSPVATNTISGTSMAAPHVAGAVALLLQRDPLLTPSQIVGMLTANATSGVVTNEGLGSPNLLLYNPPLTAIPLAPARLMDTRASGITIDSIAAGIGARTSGTVTELQITGRAGIPADASAVVLNVTVTEPTAAGFVTIYPCGTAIPNSSNLNYTATATIANAVIAKLGPGGKICIYTNATTHLVTDINGYYPAGT